MPTQTPLWKQLLGACAGAAVAVLVYEAFLLIPVGLQALVTLPTAPDVHQQDQAAVAGDAGAEQTARIASRNREAAERLGLNTASSAPAMHAAAASSSSARSSSLSSAKSSATGGAGLKGVADAAKALLTGSSSSASKAASLMSSAKASSSRSSKSFVAPVVPSTNSDHEDPVVVTKEFVQTVSVPHGESLPSSGAGEIAIAIVAFGATLVRHRMVKARK